MVLLGSPVEGDGCTGAKVLPLLSRLSPPTSVLRGWVTGPHRTRCPTDCPLLQSTALACTEEEQG